jgi:N,N'-diacetylbacillosaminyl-diphospho-undecaprenol alpha-1,3-N-acetylgalactosaminyltransferase
MRIVFFSHLDMNIFLFRLSWMKALREAGHEVLAVVPPGEYFERFAGEGFEAVPFAVTRGSLNPVRLAGTVGRLRRVFEGLRPDAVDTFTLQGSIIGSPAARRAGVPRIFCHVTGLGYLFTETGWKARLLRVPVRRLARRAFAAARRVSFQNEQDLQELADLVPAEKTVIIRGTGIDTVFFAPAAADLADVVGVREQAGIAPGDVVVTFIGRLLTHKGIVELVRAVEEVAARHPHVRLLVVGWRDEGNPAVVSEEFMARLSSGGHVRFLGMRQDIREILAATDVYALPSYREGTPRTVLEAMAMGKPVITTDAPGCRQTVEDGVTGLLVPVGDHAAVAAALERLVGDEQLRRRMGAAGRARAVRVFSNEVVVREVVKLHES